MTEIAFRDGYHRFEWMHLRRSGETIPVESALTRIPFQGGDALFCVLRDVLADDFAQLIPAYLLGLGEMLDQLPGAGERGELADVERYAHSIKSASQNLGAWHLAELGERLETQAYENRLADVPEQTEAMRQEFEKVQTVLESY